MVALLYNRLLAKLKLSLELRLATDRRLLLRPNLDSEREDLKLELFLKDPLTSLDDLSEFSSLRSVITLLKNELLYLFIPKIFRLAFTSSKPF